MTDADDEPAPRRPAPPPEGARNFVERNLATLLAFAGAALTALFTLSGGLLKPGDPPIARIGMMAGDRTMVMADSPSSAVVAKVVPTGVPVVLSGASSTFPGGDPADLDFRWNVMRVFPDGRAIATKALDGPEPARAVTFDPDVEGAYEAVLQLSDPHECNRFVEILVKAGCHRSASAVLRFAARKASPPEGEIKVDPPYGSSYPFNASVSATVVGSFDDAEAGSLKWVWTLDGRIVSRRESFALSVARPADLAQAAADRHLVATVTDAWGNTALWTYDIRITEPQVTLSGTVASANPVSPDPHPAAAGAGGRDTGEAPAAVPDLLTTPYEMTSKADVVRLPPVIRTNGNTLRIRARRVIAQSTRIRAFDQAAASGATGPPGDPGRPGGMTGEAGSPGGAGRPGADGGPGRDAAPIEIEADELAGDLFVDDSGMSGGAGGLGGAGGDGGAGAPGSPATAGLFDCRSGPGFGGSGGDGGAGGNGGAGSNGGRAASVSLRFARTEGSHVTIVSAGGSGGQPGVPGIGGRGGLGGPEGHATGWCTGAGRGGRHGEAGRPGSAGTTGSPGSDGLATIAVGPLTYQAQGSLGYPHPAVMP